MRSRYRPLVITAATAVGVFVAMACGGPRYPACDNDDQCNGEGHKGVCVEHLCTQCRNDAGCSKGQQCSAGACVAKATAAKRGESVASTQEAVECDDFHACTGKTHCQNGHCVGPPKGGPGCTDFPGPTFDFESPDLRPDSRKVIERLAKCLTTGTLQGAHVLLTGHCDNRGEEEFNMTLGAQRAENVRGVLLGLGVTEERVATSS